MSDDGRVIAYLRVFRQAAPACFYIALACIGVLIGDLISLAFS